MPSRPVLTPRAALRSLSQASPAARWAGVAGGCVAVAVGVAAMLASGLGVGPYDALIDGVARTAGLPFGVAAVLVGGAALGVGTALGGRAGLGTVAAVLAVGPLVSVMRPALPATGAVGAGALLAGGLAMFAVGVAALVASRLGVGPPEVVMLGLTARGVGLRTARTALDAGLCAGGWLLGGTVGVGTLVFVAVLGQLLAALVPAEVVARSGGRVASAADVTAR